MQTAFYRTREGGKYVTKRKVGSHEEIQQWLAKSKSRDFCLWCVLDGDICYIPKKICRLKDSETGKVTYSVLGIDNLFGEQIEDIDCEFSGIVASQVSFGAYKQFHVVYKDLYVNPTCPLNILERCLEIGKNRFDFKVTKA